MTAISKYKFEHIKQALDHCAESVKFPPSVAEFSGYCRDAKSLDRVQSEFRTPRLEKKITDEERNNHQQILREGTESLKNSSSGGRRDYKKWARDAIALHDNNQYVGDIALRFARQALGVSDENSLDTD